MAEIDAFRGWRYDLAQVGALADVIAPPYDVIGPAAQTELYERHPCNVIRLVLNREEPGDSDPDRRYARAANFLRHWRTEGILHRDPDDCLYVLHQEFRWDDRTYTRRGFFASVRLEPFGEGTIFPHEHTMSGPKADRLKLLSACNTNLSPIFGLYPDDSRGIQSVLDEATNGQTPIEATDADGVVHRMWPVHDHDTVELVRSEMRERPIFIADGHHRYETALNYRKQLIEENGPLDDHHPANFVLMACVGMSDPGLVILPTHRVLSDLGELSAEDLESIFGDHLTLERVGSGGEAAEETWLRVEVDGDQMQFGFGLSSGDWFTGQLNDTSVMDSLAAERSETWQSLGVSTLHTLLLDQLLREARPDADLKPRYVHELREVIDELDGGASLAILVNPATLDHVREIAGGQELMPPKSTFFSPKLPSGLLFHSLE